MTRMTHTDCKLTFLLPYSPDHNPIEQAFSCIKAQLHRNGAGKGVFQIVQALHRITPSMAEGWFRASGYL